MTRLIARSIVLVALLATVVNAQAIVPASPSHPVLYAQLVEPGSDEPYKQFVYLVCVDDNGAWAGGSCFPRGSVSSFVVVRRHAGGVDYEFPFQPNVARAGIHFNTSQSGTYHVSWWNGLSGVDARGASIAIQRGTFEFLIPIGIKPTPFPCRPHCPR